VVASDQASVGGRVPAESSTSQRLGGEGDVDPVGRRVELGRHAKVGRVAAETRVRLMWHRVDQDQ
jgi:hypothetical protein